jgi:hypothetical protein
MNRVDVGKPTAACAASSTSADGLCQRQQPETLLSRITQMAEDNPQAIIDVTFLPYFVEVPCDRIETLPWLEGFMASTHFNDLPQSASD